MFDVFEAVVTFTGDGAIFIDNDASDKRARTDQSNALRGKFQRPRHHFLIGLKLFARSFIN
jgi:hypothetical protein